MSKIIIWREVKYGKQHGRRLSWEEDHYSHVKRRSDKKTGPVLDADGEQIYDVLYEGIVDDSFIQLNSVAYNNFIKENGERKDERY